MGAVNELRLMRRSFSGDASRGIQSRSGDSQSESSAPLFDYVAHVQSAEADIIEEEERAEQAESKRQFVRLLRLYFKKILTEQERRFLAECLRSGQTPYKVGRAMGLDYRTIIESVQRKHEANAFRLAALMRAVGYDYRRGLDFLPSLTRYKKFREISNAQYVRLYKASEDIRAHISAYGKARYLNLTDEQRIHRRALGRVNAQRRFKDNPESFRAANARYRKKHKEKERERNRLYRETHRAELNAKAREYRARKRAEQTKQEQRENEQANGQGNA